MRRILLFAAFALGSMPAGAYAQTGQTAWTFTIPVQVTNALTKSVNVACFVYTQPATGDQVRFGTGYVVVPLDDNGSASSTVTVNVPNTNGNPYDATDYRCNLTLTQVDETECVPQVGAAGKTGVCYAKKELSSLQSLRGR